MECRPIPSMTIGDAFSMGGAQMVPDFSNPTMQEESAPHETPSCPPSEF
jgi:hypothetical protein